MLDREAAFTQLQLQRDSLQNALKHSNGLSNAAPVQAAVLNGAGDAKQNGGDSLSMELEVRRLQNDTKRKAAQIAVLEHEQSELVKRCVFSVYPLALCQTEKNVLNLAIISFLCLTLIQVESIFTVHVKPRIILSQIYVSLILKFNVLI